jgi:hypothetical protein
MEIEYVQIRTPMTMTGNVVAAETPIYTVPSGKQLIIEFASMEAALPVGQTARETLNKYSISTDLQARVRRNLVEGL